MKVAQQLAYYWPVQTVARDQLTASWTLEPLDGVNHESGKESKRNDAGKTHEEPAESEEHPCQEWELSARCFEQCAIHSGHRGQDEKAEHPDDDRGEGHDDSGVVEGAFETADVFGCSQLSLAVFLQHVRWVAALHADLHDVAKRIWKNVGAFAESVRRVRALALELCVYVKEGFAKQTIVRCSRDITDSLADLFAGPGPFG